ncbi:DNA-binding response regulator [Halalkalibacillus sediminis]|uniref:DNA-binding response regulator n=1 Tax=Halalkalibacillus sediminis TaxID=2018042 RepID=A0A2I0QTF7_9BACI|nr:response regulator transcription factor [Halalkalibacillus sediminis]PKR77627.1 DNA-binding response regulator [Halalkalibacillus sediminis]
MQNRILVVDDESTMRHLVGLYLSNEGYHIEEAASVDEAILLLGEQSFDVITLDLMMPEKDGFELCTYIKNENIESSILMLTAKTEVSDRVKGLNMGADDYLMKPFAPEELVARVNALLRRNHSQIHNDKEHVQIKDLSISKPFRKVEVKGTSLTLTPKEFDILYMLATSPGRVYTRDNIMDNLWGENDFYDPRTVDTHVKNLRVKLSKAKLSYQPIKTVWGIGYSFNYEEDENS